MLGPAGRAVAGEVLLLEEVTDLGRGVQVVEARHAAVVPLEAHVVAVEPVEDLGRERGGGEQRVELRVGRLRDEHLEPVDEALGELRGGGGSGGVGTGAGHLFVVLLSQKRTETCRNTSDIIQ